MLNCQDNKNEDVLAPEIIKQKLIQKQMFQEKMKRKQSREIIFDPKSKTTSNLWGRKMNAFPMKHGQQVIIEWRFVASDGSSHTLVFHHEQIKKKKKSKRMLILDGIEEYSSKSKKTDFKVLVIADTVKLNVEIIDVNLGKYSYPLKINDIPYSVAFQKWKKQH